MLNFFSYIAYHIKRNLFKASKTCMGISFFLYFFKNTSDSGVRTPENFFLIEAGNYNI